jgi:excisionase family DNA binding protein
VPVSKPLPLPTDLPTLNRFLRRARSLLRRVENGIERSEEINRLAAARQRIEQDLFPSQDRTKPDPDLVKQRDQLDARIQRLTRPVGRLHEDLAAFRSELARALAGLPVDDPDLAKLRLRVEELRWPAAPGFQKPLLEPARNNLREIVLALAGTAEAKPRETTTRDASRRKTASASTQHGSEDVLTLAEAAAYLKISYQRAAELVRKKMLPAFRMGRQVRIARRDLEEFMRRGGLGA